MSQRPDLPWETFTEVVEGIVKPPLDAVRSQVERQVGTHADRLDKLHNEVTDTKDKLDGVKRSHDRALAGHEDASQSRESQLEQLLAETRAALAQDLARAERAVATLSEELRRQGYVLIALGAVCVALVGIVIAMLT